jgi:uncharacterized membrane protein
MNLIDSSEQEHFADTFQRIKTTFVLREATLFSFLFAIVVLELTGVYSFFSQNLYIITLLLLWIFSDFIFRHFVNKQKTSKGIEDLYFYFDILIELPILAVIVYLIGGVEWIGGMFFLFPIVFTSVFFSRKRALIISSFAVFYYLLVVIPPFINLIPYSDYYFIQEELHKDITYVTINTVYFIFTFYLISIIANIPVDMLKKKTQLLRKAKNNLEKERESLEAKVRDRTKELEDEKKHLSEKVKERTNDLQSRVDELERFHSLVKDRELKMVELKKEIEELKKEKRKYFLT